MTCKDCIHYDVCQDLRYGDITDCDSQDCGGFFQSKADFVEVVRCKDCRLNVANMEKDGFDITDYSGEDIVCSYFMTDGMLPDDFCSYGERKND